MSGQIGNTTLEANEDHLAVNDSLRAIATAAKIYSCLPNASAAVSIISHGPLTKAQ